METCAHESSRCIRKLYLTLAGQDAFDKVETIRYRATYIKTTLYTITVCKYIIVCKTDDYDRDEVPCAIVVYEAENDILQFRFLGFIVQEIFVIILA